MKGESQTLYLSEAEQKRLLARVRRLKGQVEAIEQRLEAGECADTLIQLILAVRGAAGQLAAELASLHLEACVQTCMRDQTPTPDGRIQRLVEVIRLLARNT